MSQIILCGRTVIFNPQNFVSNIWKTEGAKEPKRARMSPPKPLFADFKVYKVQAVAQTKKRIFTQAFNFV